MPPTGSSSDIGTANTILEILQTSAESINGLSDIFNKLDTGINKLVGSATGGTSEASQKIRPSAKDNDIKSLMEDVRSAFDDFNQQLRGASRSAKDFDESISSTSGNVPPEGPTNPYAYDYNNPPQYIPPPSTIPGYKEEEVLKGLRASLLSESPLEPKKYPAYQTEIQAGNLMRENFSPSQLNTALGSLESSLTYLRGTDRGFFDKEGQNKILQDYMATLNARSGVKELQQQRPDVFTQDVVDALERGLSQRQAREAQQLSQPAFRSLENYMQAFQEQVQTGGIHSATRMFGPATSIHGMGGSFQFTSQDAFAGLIGAVKSNISEIDRNLSAREMKTAAVMDVGRKATSVEASIINKIKEAYGGDVRKAERETGINFRGLEESFARADKLQSKLEKAEPGTDEWNRYSQQFQEAASDFSEKFKQASDSIKPQRLKSVNNDLYREIAQLSRSAKTLRRQQSLLGGSEKMTFGEKIKYQYAPTVKGVGEQFVGMNIQQLQWALMFGMSGAVFEAMTRIPMEATYQAVQPVYQTAGNITGLQPMYQEIAGFAQQAPQIMSDIQGRMNSMQALLGSRSYSQQAVSSALRIAQTQPIQFPEAMEVLTAMATYPSTRPLATQPQFQKQMFNTVQLLSMLAPEQGTGGALFAIREMLGGQFRSLQMRFNISPELLASYAGKTVAEFKGGTGEEKLNIMAQAMMNMFGGNEILMSKGAQFDVQLRNLSDSLTSALILPMVSRQNQPLTQDVLKLLGGEQKIQSSQIIELKNTELGRLLPESQQGYIERTTIQRVASKSEYAKADLSKATNIADALRDIAKAGLDISRFKSDYNQELASVTTRLYGTTQGGMALSATAINQVIQSIVGGMNLSGGIGSIISDFNKKLFGSIGSYQKATKAAEVMGGSEGGEQMKRATARLINDFLSALEDSIDEVGSSINDSTFAPVMKRMADVMQKAAMTSFKPIAGVMLQQTVRTAVELPGAMIGSGIKGIPSAIREAFSGGGYGGLLQGFGKLLQTGTGAAAWLAPSIATRKGTGAAARWLLGTSMYSVGGEDISKGRYMQGLLDIGIGSALQFGPGLWSKVGGFAGIGDKLARVGGSSGIGRLATTIGTALSTTIPTIIGRFTNPQLNMGRLQGGLKGLLNISATPPVWAEEGSPYARAFQRSNAFGRYLRYGGIGIGGLRGVSSMVEGYRTQSTSMTVAGGIEALGAGMMMIPNPWTIGIGTAMVGGAELYKLYAGYKREKEQKRLASSATNQEYLSRLEKSYMETPISEAGTKAGKEMKAIEKEYKLPEKMPDFSSWREEYVKMTKMPFEVSKTLYETTKRGLNISPEKREAFMTTWGENISPLMSRGVVDFKNITEISKGGNLRFRGDYEKELRAGIETSLKAAGVKPESETGQKMVEAILRQMLAELQKQSQQFKESKQQVGETYRREVVPQIATRTINEMLYENWQPTRVSENLLQPENRQLLVQKLQEFVPQTQGMVIQGAKMNKSLESVAMAYGAVSPEEYMGFRKSQGMAYKSLLEKGLISYETLAQAGPQMAESLMLSGASMEDIGQLFRKPTLTFMSKQVAGLETQAKTAEKLGFERQFTGAEEVGSSFASLASTSNNLESAFQSLISTIESAFGEKKGNTTENTSEETKTGKVTPGGNLSENLKEISGVTPKKLTEGGYDAFVENAWKDTKERGIGAFSSISNAVGNVNKMGFDVIDWALGGFATGGTGLLDIAAMAGRKTSEWMLSPFMGDETKKAISETTEDKRREAAQINISAPNVSIGG